MIKCPHKPYLMGKRLLAILYVQASVFTIPLRGKVLEDKLRSLRFIPSLYKKPTFDLAIVIHRYIDIETIKEWDRDGTMIVCGIMNELLKGLEILELKEHKIRMYMYYKRMIEGRKNFGWVR